MKILLLSPFFPSLFANHAGGVIMGKEIEELSKNNEVFVLSFIQNDLEQKLFDESSKDNYFAIRISKLDKALACLLHPDMPNFFAVRRSGLMKETIISIIREKCIDAVHIEYTSMGQYAAFIRQYFPSMMINMVMHDVVLQSYERQQSASSGIKLAYLRMQTKLVFKCEKKHICDCDNIFVFSEKDRQLISDRYGCSNAIAVNAWFDIDKEVSNGEKLLKTPFSQRPSICFFGQLARPENADAAQKLISYFKKCSLPGAKLYIIGANPPQSILDQSNESIVVTGFVDDADEYMMKCHLAVYPLSVGAGIKIKVLHAMALGLCVITTDIGAEGIDPDGKIICIAESDEDFCKKMSDLFLSDKSIDLAISGREYVSTNFSWSKTSDVYFRIYN